MSSLPAKRKIAIGLAVGAAIAAGAAYAVRAWHPAPSAAGPNLMQVADQAATESYTCPMHGSVLQHHPGNCPICGMTLVKVAPAAMQSAAPVVAIDHAAEHNMGVRLEAAAMHEMARSVDTFATISADDSRVVALNPKVEGWIRRIYVQGAGQQVHKGQLLYEIYSPELQQRQREYVDLLQRRDGLLAPGGGMTGSGPNQAMLGSIVKERFRMRDRLLAADMPPELIEKLEQDRRIFDVVPVRAIQDGTVLSVGARAGSYVNPMQNVLTYGDYRRTWAEITLFPDQLSWIHNGDTVVLTSGLDPTQVIRARVDIANLQFDAGSRSARLRLSLDNPQQAFSPGAYAQAEIRGTGRHVLSVPRDSLIRTGHGDFVVKAVGPGQYQTVPVQAGLMDHEQAEIVKGLAAGDQVAVNAQFLLDSAGSLQAMQQRQAAERQP